MINKIVILDRDGVINEDLWGYVTRPEDFKAIKGSIESIARLSKKGVKIAIATNQACINKKIITSKELNQIHKYMIAMIEKLGGSVDFIAYCPHSPEENCKCRKPETGLLKKISLEMNHNLKCSYFIGDKESDIKAAIAFGCTPLLVKTGYGMKTLDSDICPPKEHCFKNLEKATDYIIKMLKN